MIYNLGSNLKRFTRPVKQRCPLRWIAHRILLKPPVSVYVRMMKKNQRNIVLIGMPGVGKSTVGVLLAKQLGMGFIDTDIVIQSAEGQTLAQIIARHGISGFLQIESAHLLSLNLHQHVIATGGSAVYSQAAMTHLAQNGTVVFLDLALPQLRQRLNSLDDRGVTRKPGQNLNDLFSERQPLYQRYADLTIDCNDLNVEAVKQAICQKKPTLNCQLPPNLLE